MIGLISELGYNRDTGATYQVDTAERTLPKLVSRGEVSCGFSHLLGRVDFHIARDWGDVCKQNRMNYSKVLGCFRRTALD